MGDSSGSKGCSNIKNLKTLLAETKKKFNELHPDDKRWPCPFCLSKNRTLIQCRIHIMNEHANIYYMNEEEFSFLMDDNTLFISNLVNSSLLDNANQFEESQTDFPTENTTETLTEDRLKCGKCNRIFNIQVRSWQKKFT